MPEVALAAGYQSTRRFNAEIQRAFERTPTELRRRALGRSLRSQSFTNTLDNPYENHLGRGAGPGLRADLELRIPVAPPHDLPALLHFFASRAIAGVELVGTNRYTRSVRLEGHGEPLVLSVAPAPRGDALSVRVSPLPPKLLPRLVAGVRRMFAAHVLPGPVREHLERDPLLRRAFAKHPGLRVPGAWDPFELSVRALLGQQISVRAAQTLAGRLVAALGEPLPAPLLRAEGPTHLFPAPEAIAEAGAARLSKLGVMPARARVLERLARAVAEKTLDFEALRALPLEEACAAIDALPGFGPWSAHYIALRALGEPDAFPLRDLGLLRALQREKPAATFADLEARAERWRPFRATAAIALWLTLSLDG